MARVVSIAQASAGRGLYTTDIDTSVVAVSATGQTLVTTDASQTYSGITTPGIGSIQVAFDNIAILTGAGFQNFPTGVPVAAGKGIYVSTAASNQVTFLYLEP